MAHITGSRLTAHLSDTAEHAQAEITDDAGAVLATYIVPAGPRSVGRLDDQMAAGNFYRCTGYTAAAGGLQATVRVYAPATPPTPPDRLLALAAVR